MLSLLVRKGAGAQVPVALRFNTTDNRLANPDQIVDVRIVSVASADPNYAGRTAPPVAIEVTDRGAYGLQEIPVNRWLGWLMLALVFSGFVALPRAARRSP